PYEYKDFEGVIPKGNYGAGTVMIWDEGEYHALGAASSQDGIKLLREGLASGQLKVFLRGEKLIGGFALIKLGKYKGRPAENAWLLVKERDEYAQDRSLPDGSDLSARSGKTLSEIAEFSEEQGAVWKSGRTAKKVSGRPFKKNLPEDLD